MSFKTFITEKNKTDKPFFIYWATYTQQITGAADYQNAPNVDRANAQSSMMAQHNDHVQQLLGHLDREERQMDELIAASGLHGDQIDLGAYERGPG